MCGIRYRANQLRKGEDGFWRCVQYCLEVPPLTRDRISAESQKRKEAPPPPHGIVTYDARGNMPNGVPRSAYAEEEIVFNFLADQPVRDAAWAGGIRYGVPPHNFIDASTGGAGAPAADPATGDVAYSILATGEAIRYLANIVIEAKRPQNWRTRASAKVRELADWLITLQRGFGTAPTSTKTNDGLWGGIINQDSLTANYFTTDNAAAGYAFLLAYRTLGDAKYLTSAQASASFLRNMQASPVTPYLGALPLNVDSFVAATRSYYPSGLLAVEFWNELLETSGDGQYGSDGTPAPFATVPQQLLSQCIADARAFWSVGAFDASAGQSINGLSSATACEYYNGSSQHWIRADNLAYPDGTLITGQNWAIGLRGLFAFEGFSSQVADCWNYLMSFGTNASFVSPANTLAIDYPCASTSNAANPPAPPVGQGNIIAPGYDPTLALTTNLQITAPPKNGVDFFWSSITAPAQQRSTYDWTTAGLLAAIQSSRNSGAFRKAKIAAITGRMRTLIPFDGAPTPITDTPLLRGSSGLAFQMNHFDDVDANGNPVRRLWSALAAALIGNLFRYQPQAFSGAPAPGPPYAQAPPGVVI